LVEEALANVRQHSGSPTARVSVGREPNGSGERLVLKVEDRGKGLPEVNAGQAAASGSGARLGFARMRERLAGLGGELQIQSEVGKTVVTAVIPIATSHSGSTSS
jgi:two-component system NarL family sensor kinase